MATNWTGFILFIPAALSGLYAGIGFFSLLGHNPALRRMSDDCFAEYWQQLDLYMGARMPLFGITLVCSVLVAVIVSGVNEQYRSMVCLLIALLVLITDIIFTLRVNHPLNIRIQSWNLNRLPADVSEIRQKVIAAFEIRQIMMMVSFLLVLLGIALCKSLPA